MTMKIAFIHYHLKPGGVTTVIRQQIQAIQDDCEVLAIAGEMPDQFPAPVAALPGIAYDRPGSPLPSAEDTAADILNAIHRMWPEGCDLLHIHNPTLAKNRNFLKVINILQQRGIRMLLQIHDFSEDGRPLSYSFETYPENCHYCVINSRDHTVLTASGLDAKGLHLLPNMINPLTPKPEKCRLTNLVLYPVRAIRRKNIGEAILLSAYFRKRETLAITLPPNSPMDIAGYEGWKAYCLQHNLPVLFDASATHDFRTLVNAARYLITTSINEGFGFSFLEPWTAGKFLYGRSIPDISIDFIQNGVQLDHLYRQILIPLHWLDLDQLRQTFQSTLRRSLDLFRWSPDTADLHDGFEDFVADDHVDFGMLHEPFQKQVISRILSSQTDKRRLADRNPFLADLEGNLEPSIVDQNQKAILAHYNPLLYRERLLNIYQQAVSVDVIHGIDKATLLSYFLTPSRLNLLKWCAYE